MELLAAAAALLIIGTAVFLASRRVRAKPSWAEAPLTVQMTDGLAIVRVVAVTAPPDSPAVQRLVRDASDRIFAASPQVQEVQVRTQEGVLLGERKRPQAAPAAPGHDPLLAPHPDIVRHPAYHRPRDLVTMVGDVEVRPALPRQVFEIGERPARRPLAESFDLPEKVRGSLSDPDDPVDLVRALLEAAGRPVRVEEDVLRSGDRAVLVIRTALGRPVDRTALDHAYLRYKRSGAVQGIVVSPGVMSRADVRRRELLDPTLLHAGPDGIQRMADAVMLGLDPLAFAAGPVVPT